MNQEQLEKLRESLPKGAQKEIAKKTGYSMVYIGMVLRGKRPVTLHNGKIIREALKLIEKHKRELEKLNITI